MRGDYASYPLEVITDLPRPKQTRGGGDGGRRRRPYGDMGVTMVDEGHLPPAAAFRSAGNRSLFRFEDRSSQGDSADGAPADTIVEATLRLARESNSRAAAAASRSAATAAATGAQDHTFLTAVERQREEEEAGDAAGLGRLLGQEPGGPGAMSTRLLRGPVDPLVRGDPVKLRMALTALRYTLKHPVTSSMDSRQRRDQPQTQGGLGNRNENGSASAVMRSDGNKDTGVGRKTAAARARQLPRRPYRLLKGPHQPSYCAGLLDGPTRGGGETLGRVDEVSCATAQVIPKGCAGFMWRAPPHRMFIVDKLLHVACYQNTMGNVTPDPEWACENELQTKLQAFLVANALSSLTFSSPVAQVLTSMGAGMDAMVLEKRASQNTAGTQPGRPELSSIIRNVNAVLDENEC